MIGQLKSILISKLKKGDFFQFKESIKNYEYYDKLFSKSKNIIYYRYLVGQDILYITKDVIVYKFL